MTAILELPATRKSHLTCEGIRTLFKQNLGLNARQVSVSRGHSLTYIDVTVRDPKVDLNTVKEFCASLSTWEMSQDDCVTGQSISMRTAREVDDAHAAPFLDEVKSAIEQVKAGGTSPIIFSTGALLMVDDGELYVRREGGKRGTYIRRFDAESGADWAIRALALHVGRI